MITKDIDINGEKFRVVLTEQVSAEISSTIQEISKSVEPKPSDMHLDNLIQQIIKTVNDKNEETDKQSMDRPVTRKTKKRTKKVKPKK